MRATYLSIVLCLVVFSTSCRKQNDTTLGGVDSAAQSIYAVGRSGSAKTIGNVLLAPFNLASPYDPGHLMITDGAGYLLKSVQTPAGVLNFRKWEINGQTRYSWFVYDQSLYSATAKGYQQGYVVIADESLNQIKQVKLLPAGGVTDVSHQSLDGHDFILLDDNHYIAMAYVVRVVSNIPTNLAPGGIGNVATPVIQEVQNGQVIWQWEGSNYPEFYTTSVEGNDFTNQATPQDYMHMNSITVDSADGNLICSFRTCDQVVKLNRKTGDIIWRLGGPNSDFPLTSDMQFLRQHYVTFTDGGHTLIMFDNGEISIRPYSRILEFQLNEEDKTITSFKSYNIPEPFTGAMGSVQKIGRHYFIGGGNGNYVLDVNYTTGEKVLELTSTLSTYRAIKY